MNGESVIARLVGDPGKFRIVRRGGRVLLALPERRDAALRALALYQPQRFAARVLVRALRGLASVGLHRFVLPKPDVTPTGEKVFPEMRSDSLGLLIGGASHRVRRAVASYETGGGWEVAKVAFGAESRETIESETRSIRSVPPGLPGVPEVLGEHLGDEISFFRSRYVRGKMLRPEQWQDAVLLLERWVRDLPPRPLSSFREWEIIKSRLSATEKGRKILMELGERRLVPAVRHGDFARWNLLRQADGTLLAIDWEWANPEGVTGFDLVHFFLQDARLIERLSPQETLRSVRAKLQHPRCRDYLIRVGWDDLRLLMVATLAFVVGAKQQEAEAIFEAIMAEA